MKELLLALMFLPVAVFGEQIPPGCYVADYYRTDECYEPGVYNFQWYNPGFQSIEFLLQEYGEVMTDVLLKDFQVRVDAARLEASIKKQKSLASKLRRACGSKCKNIK